MPPTNFPYDVFISYSHKDKTWVRKQLLPGLEKAGLKVMIDYRDFRLGAPSVIEMERAVTSSRKTIMVLTQNYLDSAWAEFENLMLQTLDPANRTLRLIPLRLEDCELPLRYNYLTYVDFTDADPEEIKFAWERLLAALQAPASPSPTNPPDPPLSRSHPPDRECEDLKKTMDIARRALNHLERQKIAFGLRTPPHILIEVEDKKKSISGLQAHLDALECV